MKDLASAALKVLALLCLPILSFAQDNALQFDGINDNISFVSAHPYAGGDDLTFEAWIRPSTADGFLTIASWSDGGGPAQITHFYINNGVLELFTDDGVNGGSVTGTGAIVANVWQHVAFVRDNGAGTFRFYINGVEEDVGNPTGEAGLAPNFVLGSQVAGFNFFPGLMDEVRIWNSVLDQTTIQNQMRTALDPSSHSTLQAYYQFNHTTGTALVDLTANGYDGVLNSFPDPTDPNWQTSPVLSETFTVLNTNDSFSGSLREAINNANASMADNVTIDFNIPGGGPWTIALSSDLPNITRSVTIDGTSQPGWNFSTENMVTLDLSGVINGDGFNVLSANVTIQGMRILNASFGILVNGELFDNQLIQDNIINQNITTAISIINADNVTIQGNHIGVSGDGTTNQATSGGGIAATSSDNIVIGGDRSSGDGNHIAGSAFSSYLINVSGTTNMATLEGNLVGASVGGSDITTSRGVYIDMVDNVFVGNADNNRRNYIAGIDDVGALHIRNGDQVNVINNYIGIGLLDTHAIGNASGNPIPGIELFSVTNFTIDGNVTSGNRRNGITLSANTSGGSIINNLIGVRPDGTTAFGSTENGILISGSTVTSVTIGGAGNENIIAYNQDNGISTAVTSFGSVDIRENSIFCNNLLGINVSGTPVVAAPVITSVSTTAITGTASVEDNANILIFQSTDACNSDQGHTFLVEGVDVVAGGVWTVSGSFSLSNTYTAVVVDDETAVDAVFGPSEFSPAFSSAVFTVTNTGDAGAGSLRQAIIDANASLADQVQVNFGIISGGGPWTINLTSALPALTRSMAIDGSTQPAWDMDAGLMVELDGTSAGNVNALEIQSANVEIYGLHITNMQGNTNITGVGIYINGETHDNFIIGGPGRGNVIGGGRFGISITDADNGIIQSNRIGTTMAGTAVDGNGFHGVFLSGSDGTLIGGDAGAFEGNVISANALLTSNDYGIEITNSDNVDVYGNLIGTDKDGNNDLGNRSGVNVTTGADFINIGTFTSGRGNTISGNNDIGVTIQGGTNVSVNSNIIGLNSAGNTSVGNTGDGVLLNSDGAGMDIRGNTISANTGNGIQLDGVQSAATIVNNLIGTDASGGVGSGHGNLAHGIAFRSSNGLDNAGQRISVEGNTISGNGDNVTDNGINFNLTNSNFFIIDNKIGVESNGLNPLGNTGEGIEFNTATTNVELGGFDQENDISNNAGSGILFFGASNSNGNIIELNSMTCNGNGPITFSNTPDIDAPVISTLTGTTISGTSTASVNSTVHVFRANDGCNNDGAVTSVGTGTVQADGTWSITGTFTSTVAHSAYVIDNATGNVSEFSAVNFYTVTSTADAGAGSLRQAITDANASASNIIPFIDFNIAGGGPWTISTLSILPTITKSMIIDATTQPGWIFGDPNAMVIMDGVGAGSVDGWVINAANVGIFGLVLDNFNDGIFIFSGSDNLTIGSAGNGNVIKGSAFNGIVFSGSSDNVTIQGNYIGTSINGLSVDSNLGHGISITGTNILLGGDSGAGEGNVISGNGNSITDYGVQVASSSNVDIYGNYIGTDRNGNNDLGNNRGINITTGSDQINIGTFTSGHGNVVSGNNSAFGIVIQGGTNIIVNSNIVGLNAAGNTSVGNVGDGIRVTTDGAGIFISSNVISANTGDGIDIDGVQSALAITNNLIGTDISGAVGSGHGNLGHGISFRNSNGLDNAANRISVEGNTVSGNGDAASDNGINFTLTNSNMFIIDNKVGVESGGINPLGNFGNGIEFSNATTNIELGGFDQENDISNNGGSGIFFNNNNSLGNIIELNSLTCNTDGPISFSSANDIDAPLISALSASGISGTSTASVSSTVYVFRATDGCNNDGAFVNLGSTTVQADGTWSFSGALNTTEAHSAYIIDNATGNVSEFSAAQLFEVTTTADAGPGSLRQAILDANGSLIKVIIDFSLPQPNDIINLTSGPLPVLNGNITIDATTQTGWNFGTGMIPTVRNNCSCADGFETGGGTIEIFGLRIADFTTNGISSPILTGDLTVGASGKGNIIVNNGADGINRYTAAGFIAQGNYLGLEFDGTAAGNTSRGLEIQGAGSGAIIGGAGAGEGNVIGSNGSHGIFFNNSDNNQIIGNYVGTDPLGTTARPNGQDGLFTGTLSDGHTIRNNIFSGNTGEGIYLQGGDNLIIQSNRIGVDINGDPMGNGNNGIYFFGAATNNRIGGLAADANDIGSNGGYGILQDNASSNANFYPANSIHDNTLGGISHAAGVNSGIVPAVITTASTTDVSGTGVIGERVHLYLSDGNGQGETLLDSADVDAGGNWTISGLSILLTDELVATATDLTNGTSEFSAPFQQEETFTVINTLNSGGGSLREAITTANGSIANNVMIDFNIPVGGGGPWTISLSSTLPSVTRSMIIDGSTQTNWDMNTDQLVVVSGSSGTGLTVTSTGVEIYGLKVTGFPVNGIEFNGSGSGGVVGDAARGNVINGVGNIGIRITGITDVIIQGNRIGTNFNGTSAVANPIGINLNTGAHSAVIGGPGAGDGNLISGNFIGAVSGGLSDNHQFEGNIIGLNISHNAAIPNGVGLSLTPTNGNTIHDNIISGNSGAGIELGGSNQIITANTIGTDLTGITDFGNTGDGIRALNGDYDNWQIGTGNPGDGNVIAFNGQSAVELTSVAQTGHLISENSIYNNTLGLSIGIANNGITAPNITNVTSTNVSVDGVANGDLVEVFLSDGNGQGETFLGSATASGSTVTVGSLSQTIELADRIVTTRIDATNNTSEFSAEFLNYPSVPGSGSSLSFNGSSDNVSNTTPTGLPVGSAQRTVELWFKATKDLLTDTNTGLIQWGTTLTGQMFGLITSSNAPGKLYFFGNFADLVGTTDLVQDQWYHAAVRYDGVNVTLYLNGVEEATATIALNTVTDANGLSIGFRPGVAFWDGEIDEVRIWDISLSQATIRDWATRKLDNTHVNYANLVSYYRFDQGTGTLLADLAGDNDGTISGATWSTSGAHLGDESAYVLGNSSVVLGPTAASGNNLTVNNIQGNPDITYLYRVDEAPNDLTLAPGLNSLNSTDYYGVFQTGGTNPTFNAQWFYTNNTGINGQPDENGIRFLKRQNNEDAAFDEISSNFLDINLTSNIVIDRNLTSGEFAQGVTNAYPEPAPPGNALNFDGVNDAVDLGTSLENVFAGVDRTFTIEAWINPETFTGDNRKIILAKNGNSNCALDERQFAFVASPDEGLRFVYYGANDLTQWRAFEGGAISANTWQHVAMTYDGSIDTGDGIDRLRFYINGVEQTIVPDGGAGAFPFDITSGPSHVGLGATLNSSGAVCDNPDHIFDGPMDEVRIWDTVLDQSTILSYATQTLDNAHPNYDNLQAYYRFDDSDGSSSVTNLRDLAATNDGTLINFPADNSANWVSSGALDMGIFNNNALDLDGTDDFIFLPVGIELTAQPASTVEAWFRVDGNPAVNLPIYSEEVFGSGATTYILRVVSNVVQFGVFDGSAWSFSSGSTQIQPGRWYHVAATYQDGVGTKIYLDGCLEDENSADGRNPIGPSGGIKIGHQGAVNELFDGAIDEVRLWSIAKDETQIRNEILTELAGNEPGLRAYYDFNQGIPTIDNTGETTLLDRTVNGYDGPMQNFALNGNNSNWVFSGAFDPTPNEPVDLFATEVSGTQIDLSWTDKSFNETLFLIERSDGNNTSFAQIGTAPTDATSYSDNTVTAGNGYFYRVRATNGMENSGYSNEKFASTLTPPGNALQLDGADDFVDLGNDAAFYGHQSLTLEAWVNPDYSRNNTEYDVISTIGTAGGTGYQITINNDGTLNVFFRDASINDEILFGSTALPEGQWSHIAGVIENAGASTNLYLYINGTLDNSTTVSDVPAYLTSGNLTLGSNGDGAAGSDLNVREFHGEMDEVRIWNAARTQLQIQTNMNTSIGGNEADLIAYYKFDQDEATDLILPDRSTNNNNGTWSGNASGTTTPIWPASGAFTPPNPSNLFTTEVSDMQIDLTWVDNSSIETGFTIERSTGNNSSWGVINTVGPDVTSYSDNSVTPDNGYYYRIIANGGVDSAPSNEKFASTLTPPGNGLDFDGVDDYVNLGDPDELRIGGNLTIEAWVNWAGNTTGTTHAIISRSYDFGETADTDIFYRFGITSAGLLTDFFEHSSGVNQSVNSTEAISAGVWTHVAMVRNATTLTEDFYINGEFAGRSTIPAVPTNGTHPGQRVWIGNRLGATLFFDGIIDEVRVWNVVRTASEIQTDFLAASSLVGNEPGLAGYFRFDQSGNFSELPDRSVNNSNGVLTNFPADPTANWVGSQAMLGAGFQPQNLFATEVSATQIDLSWDAPLVSPDGYSIERSDGNNTSYVQIGTTSGTTFSDNTVTAGNGYFYRIIGETIGFSSVPSREKFGSTITSPGNALEFDGIDDNLIVYNPDDLGGVPGQSFTWETWLRVPPDITGGSGTIRGFLSTKQLGPNTPRMELFINKTTGLVQGALQSAGGASAQSVVSTTDLRDFQWHHVAWVRDAVADELRLYIDGTLEASATDNDVDGSNNGDLYIGDWAVNTQNGRTFFENMDEVRFWNVARTSAEIRAALGTSLVGNESGLVAYYKFDQDETTDLILPDRSRNFNNGVWNGPVAGVTTPIWVASGANDASVLENNTLDFDSNDDYVSIPHNAAYDSNPLTVEFWFYKNNSTIEDTPAQADSETLVMKNATFSAATSAFQFSLGGSQTAPFELNFAAGNGTVSDFVTYQVEPMTWYHVAGVINGSVIEMYVDGKFIGQADLGSPITTSAAPISLGSRSALPLIPERFFNGKIDELRIWSQALDENAIQANIFNELLGNEANLIGYYNFDQGSPGGTNTSVTTLVDSSPTGNNGVLNNFALTGSVSNWVASGAPDLTPNAPADLFVTEVSDTQIDLSWTDCAFNETDFFIERSDGNNTTWVQIGMVEDDVTTFSDNSVTAGNGYFYRVRSANGFGNSEYSNEKFGSTIALPGNALAFDGTDDVVTVPHSSELQIATTVTMSAWVRRTNLAGVDIIAEKGGDWNVGETNYGLGLHATNNNMLYFFWDGGWRGTSGPSDTRWHHVAVVATEGNADPVLYIDGVLQPIEFTQGAATITLNETTTRDLHIGAQIDPAPVDVFSSAEIDELRIWNTTLSQAQIQTNLSQTLIGNEANLVAYYRFDQDEATDLTLPDRSLNNNHGTWSGSGGGVTTPQWPVSGAIPPEARVYLGVDNTGTELFDNQAIPVNFGRVSGSMPLTFTIENTGFRDLDVSNITSNGTDFTITSATSFNIMPGSSVNFTVQFNSTPFAIDNESITVHSNDPAFPTLTFPVTGTALVLEPKVWWTDDTANPQDDISRSDLDGSNTQAPYYTGFSVDIRGIAVDTTNNMVFWTNTDAEIYCGRIGESGFTATGGPIIDESGASPQDFLGIDVDGTAGKIYWADAENGQIRRVNFDGTSPEVLVTIDQPRDVAIDVAGGKIYFVANPSFTPQVLRSDLDGSNTELLYSSGSTFFEGIALDLTNGHIYWTESVGGVSRSDLDGSNQIFVSSQVSGPTSIDVDPDNEMMYVVDGASIIRINYQDDPVEVIQSGASVTDPIFLSLDTRQYFGPKPNAPTNLLTAEVSNTQIDLSWTDNSTDELNFAIERSTGNNTSFTTLTNVGADVTTYSDNTVTAGNGYFYRVTATTISNVSDPSNEKFGSTLTSPGNALQFDGIDDEVTFADPLQTTWSDFTIEFWAMIPSGNSAQIDYFEQVDPAGGGTPQIILTSIFNNTPYFFIRNTNGGTGGGLVQGTTVINDNNWHHLAYVREGTEIRVYVDGLLNGTSTMTAGDVIFPATATGKLGGDAAIDEFRLWNVAYSETQIRSLSLGSLVGNDANLISYYRFDQDETTDLILPDRSVNNNNGTWSDGAGGTTTPQWIASGAFSLGGVIPGDYYSLRTLYNSTDGANWTDNTNWLTTNAVSTWYGVTTVADRVTELRLHSNNLVGTVPTELGDLSNLTYLSFQDNVFTGSIPTLLGNSLTNLTHLALDGNQFTGSIPAELGMLTNLDFLDLDRNMLTGTVPVELTMLTNLTQLRFDENQLTGTLHADFGNLTGLTHFEFNDNMFSGAIPATYANLINLQFFNIRNNNFTDLPDLSAITGLVSTRLDDNAFEFNDLEPNAGLGGVDYNPQANVPAAADVNLNEGDNLNVTITVAGSANQYQWFRDGMVVSGQTADNLSIASVTASDAGSYHLEVTNTAVTGLTISSDPFNVSVDQDPTVVTQDISVTLDSSLGNVTITPAQIDNGSSDDVTATGNLIFALDIVDFGCADLGANTVTLTVTDENGNSSSGTATVTVSDITDPTVVTQDITVNLDFTGQVMIVAGDIDNGSFDNCSTTSSVDIDTFDCTNLGANTVTLTMTDPSGNNASATATVTIEDNMSPSVVTQDITVTLDNSNQASITPADIDNGTSDNCSFTLSLDVSTFGLAEVGDNIVTLTATDVAGNSANATATVTVQSGNQPPGLSYIFYVNENTPNGTLIGAVVATDPEGDPLTYSILGGNTGNAFAIDANNGNITVNSEVALDFETTPVFNLIVQSDDGNGGITMVNITINLNDIDENVLGVEDLEEQISVYPNPTDGMLFIELADINTKDLDVRMYSVSGSEVLNKEQASLKSDKLLELNLEALKPGIYLLKIQHEAGILTKNILVK